MRLRKLAIDILATAIVAAWIIGVALLIPADWDREFQDEEDDDERVNVWRPSEWRASA